MLFTLNKKNLLVTLSGYKRVINRFNKKKEITYMIITTTENIPGKEYEILGLVNGNNIQSKNIFRDFTQGIKNITGGELHAYTEMMMESRNTAEERMIEQAKKLNADAIVMVRFNTSSIVENSSEVHCYGTAVKFI